MKTQIKIFSLFSFIFTLFFVNSVFSAPILRIEVGQHTAMINRMSIDKEAKLLATASDDKTVRLWNLPEGTLYTTLRIPIGEHLKGALYAVAVSPDGKTVITSGETIDDNQKFSLYVFDVEKRVLKARIANLPSAIYHLAYSKDGKYFAAAFAGGYGIRIWDSQTGKPVAQDTDYQERSTWLDFNESGNLATVSHDGFLRLYDNQFSLIKKANFNPKGKPNSIAFSANGQRLAIGYSNSSQVDIVDINLNKITTLMIENLTATNTAIVEWGKNSNTELFVSGDMRIANGNFIIRHWQNIESSNSFKDTEVSKNIVTDIISLDNDKIETLFSCADPAWGGVKNDQLVYKNKANLWDARLAELPEKIFSISEDGLKIAYSQNTDSNELTTFDITHLELQPKGNEELVKKLSPAIKESNLINITNWHRAVPLFNKKKLDFDNYEKALALAINSTSDHFLIGTNYYLRWYDKRGKEIKKITVPSEVYGVNISANGKLAVAALGDGTIHWYSLATGEELEELVTLFPYNNGKDWIVWTKEGFFASSDGGAYKLAGYHLDKGDSKRPEWIDFSQVYQIYYAPELIVPKLLRQEDKITARLNKIENVNDRFNKNAVPIIELVEYCIKPTKRAIETPAPVQVSVEMNKAFTELSYFERFKLFLEKIYHWFISFFTKETIETRGYQRPEETTPQTSIASSSETQTKPECYPISGQGDTRGFKRSENKDEIKTTYRNQLGNNVDAIDVHYKIKPREGGVGDIDIYVNGQIQHSEKQVSSRSTTTDSQDLQFAQTIALKKGENEISIHAYEKTGGSAAVSDAIALINPELPTPVEPTKPKLIVLAVGIDRYEAPNQLKYAVKDSTDFMKTIAAKKSRSYSDFIQFSLFDSLATLQNIETTFDKISAVLNENDAVLIYLAGHGLRDNRDFYFIPYGVDDSNLEETALSQRILKKNIAKLAKTNKVFILIDSCHSGAVDLDGIQQEISSFDKIKHQLGDNIFILAASGENQEALDQFILPNNEKPNNGLFAYAVLAGLNGKARRLDDNIVDSLNLGTYVQRTIDTLTINQTKYKQKARFQLLEAGDILNFEITQYE
jgi:WD40 repeat protein